MNVIRKSAWGYYFSGVAARGLLTTVKPLALLASIRLDSDAGLKLAQIYLVALLVMSLLGTNAHRDFYAERFNENSSAGSFGTRKAYRTYVRYLSSQISVMFTLLVLAALVSSYFGAHFVWLGLAFGLSEKLSDEQVRYAQYAKDNISLLQWGLLKLSACGVAVITAYAAQWQIWLTFPLISLIATSILSRASIALAFSQLNAGFLWHGLQLLQKDWAQVGWVFTSMGLMNLDKWIMQFMDVLQLPKYMLFAQVAAIFIVINSMFILAPSRVDLVKTPPWKVRKVAIGTTAISVVSLASGMIAIAAFNLDSVFVFPFAFAAIAILSAAYLDHFFWFARDFVRLGTDLVIAIAALAAIGLLYMVDDGHIPVWEVLVCVFAVFVLRLAALVFFAAMQTKKPHAH